MDFDLSRIKSIIFDLGEVILDLNPSATQEAFAQLAGKSVEEVKALQHKTDVFTLHETAAVSDAAFREEVRSVLQLECSDDEIDEAYNAMLVAIPLKRVMALRKLNSQYSLFIMSNTNSIHFKRIEALFNDVSPEKSFREHFDQVYLSHEIGARKPDPKAWSGIIEDHNLNPEETLFIDDKVANLEGASTLGLQVFHNEKVEDWMKILDVD